jgi:phage-related protein
MATEQKPTTVNLGGFDFINFKITESFPPNSVFSSVFAKPGVQTTPGLARGYVPGSAIDFMNQRLTHVCDFRFIFNIDIFASLGLVNPIAAIQRAIRNAKLKAATRMRDLLQKAIEVVKKIMAAITKALNFDATGQISLVVDITKDTIRRVNQAIEDIADAIESVLEWVFFAQQIIELINWIKSLPEKIKNLLLACIANFTNSLKQAVESIQSIPGQIVDATVGQARLIADQFVGAVKEVEDAAKLEFNNETQNYSPELLALITDPTEDGANNLISYINQNTPNANAEFANTTGALMEKSSSP